MTSSTLKSCKAQFREDIAAQLRGLSDGDVAISPDRVVLELERAGEGPLRVVAGLNEDHVGQPGWADWVQLRIESDDRITPLVTLAWLDGGIGWFEKRVNPDLPLDRRGLNARADIREGRYGRCDVLDQLRADLAAVTGYTAPQSSRALTRIDPPRRVVAIVEPVKVVPDNVVDAEFTPVAQAVAGTNGAPGTTRMPSVDEVKELLIAEIFEALQHELLSREAAVRGASVLSWVKGSALEAHEWAMLGVAYAVDTVTSLSGQSG